MVEEDTLSNSKENKEDGIVNIYNTNKRKDNNKHDRINIYNIILT